MALGILEQHRWLRKVSESAARLRDELWLACRFFGLRRRLGRIGMAGRGRSGRGRQASLPKSARARPATAVHRPPLLHLREARDLRLPASRQSPRARLAMPGMFGVRSVFERSGNRFA